MSDNKADPLLPCPFCGPGQSMVDPWFDDVSKRWAIGCGRCGASSGRSVHAEGSREAAIKSWNTRRLAAPQQAAPLGGREAVARLIRKALVENWCDAYDGRQWDEDVLLTGCRKVGGGMGYRTNWRPIATAPKDEAIIVWCEGGMRGEAFCNSNDDSWYWIDGSPITPKLWQPFPDPPDESEITI